MSLPYPTTSLPSMLAAEIWHWWIGVVLTGVGVAIAIKLIVGYLKLESQKYPPRRHGADADL